MNDFVPVVREVKGMLRKIALFNAAIDTIVFFLVAYCVLAIFNLFPVIAVPAAILFFIRCYAKKYREAKLTHVEAKYPDLWERLRTAADTLHLNNFIVTRLRDEVVSKLKKVSVSSFINTSELALRVAIICVLLFSAIFVTSLNIRVLNVGGAIAGTDIGIKIGEGWKNLFSGSPVAVVNATEENNTMYNESFTDIYGNISVANLGKDSLEMTLNNGEGSLDFKNIRDTEQANFNEFPPQEVSASPADYYDDVVLKDQQNIVKKYFEQISK